MNAKFTFRALLASAESVGLLLATPDRGIINAALPLLLLLLLLTAVVLLLLVAADDFVRDGTRFVLLYFGKTTVLFKGSRDVDEADVLDTNSLSCGGTCLTMRLAPFIGLTAPPAIALVRPFGAGIGSEVYRDVMRSVLPEIGFSGYDLSMPTERRSSNIWRTFPPPNELVRIFDSSPV